MLYCDTEDERRSLSYHRCHLLHDILGDSLVEQFAGQILFNIIYLTGSTGSSHPCQVDVDSKWLPRERSEPAGMDHIMDVSFKGTGLQQGQHTSFIAAVGGGRKTNGDHLQFLVNRFNAGDDAFVSGAFNRMVGFINQDRCDRGLTGFDEGLYIGGSERLYRGNNRRCCQFSSSLHKQPSFHPCLLQCLDQLQSDLLSVDEDENPAHLLLLGGESG